MSAANAILLTVSTLAFLYLGFAMFRPERF
ncbi:MAG TPA: potassium-transporting ATPase subunit F [Acidimicrobiales bacterium]|nr:potassium-transporting ATPase subunit F [Acidimicrobiales bacterium]